jgi:transcriptional regulator with XRE-family HTH domain
LRKRSGLRQKDLARILGSVTASQISRHERSVAPPSILVALGYEALFKKSVSEIFPGLFHSIEIAVEKQLDDYEDELQSSNAKGSAALPVAIQLEWLCERRNSITEQ